MARTTAASDTVTRGNRNPVVVISPHLDDAVLSCGQLLAARPGSTVVTVFAGVPPRADELCTDWDRRCGFANAAAAIAARRAEDTRALALLRAKPLWLDFLDSQYGQTPDRDELALTLQQALRDLAPDEVLIPLGLFHSDHLLVHAAADSVLRVPPSLTLLAYEDVPYRGDQEVLQRRLAQLRAAGAVCTEASLGSSEHAVLKARAVDAYASQLRGLGPHGGLAAAQPERYWQLDWSHAVQRVGAVAPERILDGRAAGP